MNKNYQFIAITGIDGSGKSTVIKKLKSLDIDFIVADWEQILKKEIILRDIGITLKNILHLCYGL